MDEEKLASQSKKEDYTTKQMVKPQTNIIKAKEYLKHQGKADKSSILTELKSESKNKPIKQVKEATSQTKPESSMEEQGSDSNSFAKTNTITTKAPMRRSLSPSQLDARPCISCFIIISSNLSTTMFHYSRMSLYI